ncbi:MAG: RNA polymerase sigma-70 factor [Bacteroidales bacterium]|nr:RNA polymerase sigma-70 factor [Bacteroidales bacterium]
MSSKCSYSDCYLVRKLKDGDKSAFEAIFNKYKEKLYFFALGYLHSSAETEEVIQNVFISLWENRKTLNEKLSLKNFLYKSVINLVYNYFKHQLVHQKYIKHVSDQELQEDDHSQNVIAYNDLKGAVDNLIKGLPLRQQMIFKLSRQEGLSHIEIANRLGLSVRSVENQIYRALRYIRENLNKEYSLID